MFRPSHSSVAVGVVWQTLLLAAGKLVAQEAVAIDKATPHVVQAAALVDQALRRELAGDAEDRAALLMQAVRMAPEFAPARWHNAQVVSNGDWKPVEQVHREAAGDPRFNEYRTLRRNRSGSLVGEIYLARWCRKNGLSDQAAVHWRFVLGLQPKNQEAMEALGVALHENRILTPAQIVAEEFLAAQRAEADKRWRQQVDAWRRALERGDPAAAHALREIAAVNDPYAIAWMQREISEQNADAGLAVVSALAKMHHPQASGALVRHAVLSSFPEVRTTAAKALQGQPLNALAPPLLDALAMPLESSYTLLTDGAGSVFYRHEVYREGLALDVAHSVTKQLSQEVALPRNTFFRPENVARAFGAKAAKANQALSTYGNAARGIEQQVARTNRVVEEGNHRIAELLRRVTGQNLGDNPRDWWNWWAEHNELYVPEYRPVKETQAQADYFIKWEPKSCFAQGTPVWTPTGLVPIEALQIGDLVLSQNVETGELTWKPVLQVTQRPPSPMRELRIGADALFTTRGHPFWVNGPGWRMAKQLQPGDGVHTVDGPQTVAENSERVDLPAYNLVVADFSTYFVGNAGILVHDNSLAPPTTALVPGLHDVAEAAVTELR
jgi:hypothetical protein